MLIALLSFLQPSDKVPKHFERQVFIANVLASTFAVLTLLIFSISYFYLGWMPTTPFGLVAAATFLIIPAINHWSRHEIGRMLLCITPVVFTMFITVFLKLITPNFNSVFYYDSRFILMCTAILPGIVFRLQERKHLSICLIGISACILFFDSIHEVFGAGYYQQGFTDPSYKYLSYVVNITYLVLLAGILLLRSVLEKSEQSLIARNDQLIEKQNEIEAQHEELLQQREEMQASSEKLEQANGVINKQREALEKYNQMLEALVEEKSSELIKTNDELIKHNNELLQFSYTVSHNLRGPVARMLGLTRLLNGAAFDDERLRLQDMILKSSEELDEILKDLSLIIDIRNDLYKVREKVFLKDEWSKAISMIGENMKSVYQLDVNFSGAPYIYGIRPMIQSVFYNLLSNAIKYQSPDRKLRIHVRSLRDKNTTIIEFTDNGLGVDLKTQGKNIFKLYKRFHSHVPGKGLGLYLVKTQIETLGGTISIDSEVGKGTSFNVVLPKPDEVTRQVFIDNDAVLLYYDGSLNIFIVEWKRPITSEEYRHTYKTIVESLHVYNSSGWISDVRNQGMLTQEDQKWLASEIIPQLVNIGLKFVAVIGLNISEKKDYYEVISRSALSQGYQLAVFSTMDEAYKWMERSLKRIENEIEPDLYLK